MKRIGLLLLFWNFPTLASLGENYMIIGKIKERIAERGVVHIDDILGQTLELPETLLPKSFRRKKGTQITLNLTEELSRQVRIKGLRK